MDPLEMLIVWGQQSFEFHNQLNPVQITINDNRVLSNLKKHKNSYYKLTPIGFVICTKNTKQTFVTCRELNNTKVALISN